MDTAQLVKQLVARPVTYLLGQVDVLPLGGFDSSPNAMAQGPTRRARGSVLQVCEREARRQTPGDHRLGVRSQRALRIHHRCGAAGDLSK